jgi:pyridoxal phosphate enzyme (YggS family)
MISEAILTIKQRIADTALKYNRSPECVQLLAVSKTRPIADIATAIKQGQTSFGESHLQEAIPKIEALRNYNKILEWHFIGPLQSNKTRIIAEHFDWLHSLCKLKHAQRLNAQRPKYLPPLNVCIQINISEESQKSGIYLNDLAILANAIAEFPRLRLRGLMTLPAPSQSFEQQRIPFHRMRIALQELQESGLILDTLSMGMTNDFAAAIAEGSTLVRIGTGIFGKRNR